MAKARKPKRATIDALGELHGQLADDLMKRIKEGEVVLTKDGEVVTISCAVSTLNVARQFLRDNGIQADPETNEKVRSLVGSLPFASDDDGDDADATQH